MRMFNNAILILREAQQAAYKGLIILPDNKITTSKNALVLAVSDEKINSTFHKSDIKPGDRVVVLQYDKIEIPAWDNLEFNFATDALKDRLPDGATLSGNKLTIKKGTLLQVIFREHAHAVLFNSASVDDQQMV